MSWIALLIAGVFEVGWPVGFKMSQQNPENRIAWLLAAVVSMAISGGLLWWSQKTIPIGTAYAVWTGIGAVGVAILGIILFNEPKDLIRVGSILLIVAGIAGLKLSS
jgi:quaternary ammonium compound-resistance protein SugE